MLNYKNFRIKREKLEYVDGIPVREYLNDDPGSKIKIDRPSYEYLSIHDDYTGYRDLVWTPIDLPYLDIDMDLVADVSEDKGLQKNFYVTKNVGKLVFLKQNRCGMAGADPEWFDYAKQTFPEVIDYISTLPFKSIHQAFFVQTQKPIPAHYDEELSINDILKIQAPSHLHFRWSKVTDWKTEHFYMTKDSGETRVFPMLPPETNAFAYDGAVYEHGVEKGFSMRDRVQLILHGVYDLPKWHELLENSYQKYKEYAITSEHFNL